MSAPIQDGRPLASGIITAEQQAADIAGARGGLRPGATKPTPAQARALSEDRWPSEDDLPPGYERGTVVVSPELTGAPRPHRDESQPLDEAWSKIDAAKGDRRAAEQVASDFKRVQASVSRLVKKEEGMAASRENAADAATIKREISEARAFLDEARAQVKKRTGLG